MKQLLIILLLLPVLVIGQTISIHQKDLPVVTKADTVVISVEVYIEKVDEEIKQRHKIHIYEKKLSRLHNILQNKKGLESQMDSLIIRSDSLTATVDSLSAQLIDTLQHDRQTVLSKWAATKIKLNSTREQYFLIRSKNNRLNFQRFALITIIVLESTLILMLL